MAGKVVSPLLKTLPTAPKGFHDSHIIIFSRVSHIAMDILAEEMVVFLQVQKCGTSRKPDGLNKKVAQGKGGAIFEK